MTFRLLSIVTTLVCFQGAHKLAAAEGLKRLGSKLFTEVAYSGMQDGSIVDYVLETGDLKILKKFINDNRGSEDHYHTLLKKGSEGVAGTILECISNGNVCLIKKLNGQQYLDDSALHILVRRWDNVEFCRQLCRGGININLPTTITSDGRIFKDFGKTPLLLACELGHYRICEYLLSTGASIYALEKVKDLFLRLHKYNDKRCRASFLHVLATKVDCPVPHLDKFFKHCLRFTDAHNQKDALGNTPLHSAVLCQNKTFIERFIVCGGAVETYNRLHETPLQVAFKNADVVLCKAFSPECTEQAPKNLSLLALNELASFSLPNGENGWKPLHTEILENFFENQNTHKLPNNRGMSPLHVAIRYDNISMIKFLVGKKFGINDQTFNGNTTLHLAVNMSNHELVKLLIDNGAQVTVSDEEGYVALHRAILSRDSKMVDLLIDKGAPLESLDASGRSPLFLACYYGFGEIFRILVRKGASVNTRNREGISCMHFLARVRDRKFLNTVNGTFDNDSFLDCEDNDRDTPLHIAALYGNNEFVSILRYSQSLVNKKNLKNETALHVAARLGYGDVCKVLILKGADISAPDSEGIPLLFRTIQSGNGALWDFLIQRGLSLQEKNPDGETCLHYVARKVTNRDFLKAIDDSLRSTKVGPYICDEHGIVYTSHYDAYDLLDEDDDTPLHIAAIYDNKNFFEIMGYSDFALNAKNLKGETPLCITARLGFVEICKIIIKRGAEVNNTECIHNMDSSKQFQENPLIAAIREVSWRAQYPDKQVAICKLLLDAGASINAIDSKGQSPLEKAVATNRLDIVELLLDRGISCNDSLNDTGERLIHKAAKVNSSNFCALLIKKGADAHMQTKDGNTPLMYACLNGSLEGAQVFLSQPDCNVNVRNTTEGFTALFCAVQSENIDLIKLLISHNFDPNAVDKFRRSLLHSACLKNNEKLVSYLMSVQKNIDMQDKDGNTALHTACNNAFQESPSSFKIVKTLLEAHAGKKANHLIKNNSNKTPLRLAIERRNCEVVKLLISHGVVLEDEDLLYATQHQLVEICTLLKDIAPLDMIVRLRNTLHTLAKENKELINLFSPYEVVPPSQYASFSFLLHQTSNSLDQDSFNEPSREKYEDVTIQKKTGNSDQSGWESGESLTGTSLGGNLEKNRHDTGDQVSTIEDE